LALCFILHQDEEKHAIATQLIETLTDIVISSQVLNELCVHMIKQAEMGESEIQRLIRSFYARYPIVAFDESIVVDASELRERYSFSFWDSLIVASARYAGADFLLTEDMQHGQVIDGDLQIVNPFITSI